MYFFEMLMLDAVPDEKSAKENKALKIWTVVSLIYDSHPLTKLYCPS